MQMALDLLASVLQDIPHRCSTAGYLYEIVRSPQKCRLLQADWHVSVADDHASSATSMMALCLAAPLHGAAPFRAAMTT